MQSEESNTLVKLAKAVIEHAPEGGDAFWDIKFSDIETALSAAEPVGEVAGQQGRYWMTDEGRWSNWFDITFNTWVPEPGVREVRNLYATPPAPSVAVKALQMADETFRDLGWHDKYEATTAALAALSAQVQDARSDDDEETYQIGIRDGYSQAVQEIDRLTGGDGEYRYCTDHDPERHTPGPSEMIQRIVDRFETLNLIGEAERRGDFWDVPGSAQVQDVAGWQDISTLEPKNGMIVMGWGEYRERDGFSPAFMRWYDSVGGWNVNAMPFYPTHWQPLPAAPAKQEG